MKVCLLYYTCVADVGQRGNTDPLTPSSASLRYDGVGGKGRSARASAKSTDGHLLDHGRVVYRTVYRQVVKTDSRPRLQCCGGYYESSGACVRES